MLYKIQSLAILACVFNVLYAQATEQVPVKYSEDTPPVETKPVESLEKSPRQSKIAAEFLEDNKPAERGLRTFGFLHSLIGKTEKPDVTFVVLNHSNTQPPKEAPIRFIGATPNPIVTVENSSAKTEPFPHSEPVVEEPVVEEPVVKEPVVEEPLEVTEPSIVEPTNVIEDEKTEVVARNLRTYVPMVPKRSLQTMAQYYDTGFLPTFLHVMSLRNTTHFSRKPRLYIIYAEDTKQFYHVTADKLHEILPEGTYTLQSVGSTVKPFTLDRSGFPEIYKLAQTSASSYGLVSEPYPKPMKTNLYPASRTYVPYYSPPLIYTTPKPPANKTHDLTIGLNWDFFIKPITSLITLDRKLEEVK